MPNFDPRNQLLSDISSGIDSVASLSDDMSDSDKAILENIKLNVPNLDTNTLFMIREYITANLQDCLSNYSPLVSEELDTTDETKEMPEGTPSEEPEMEMPEEDTNESQGMLDKLTEISDYAQEIVDLVQNAIDNVSDMDIVTQLINIKLFVNDKLDEFNTFTNTESSGEVNMEEVLTQLEEFKSKLEGYSQLVENITMEETSEDISTPENLENNTVENQEENVQLQKEEVELSSMVVAEEEQEDENLIEPETSESEGLPIETMKDESEGSSDVNAQFEELKKSIEEISQNISTNNPEMSTSLENVQEKIENLQEQIVGGSEEIEPENDEFMDDDFEPMEDDENISMGSKQSSNGEAQSIEEQLARMQKVLNKKPTPVQADNDIIMPSDGETELNNEMAPESNDNMEIVQELRNLSFKYGKPEFEGKPEMELSEALATLSESIEDNDKVSIDNNVEAVTVMVAIMDKIVKNEIMDVVNKIGQTDEVEINPEPMLEEGNTSFEEGNTDEIIN